MLYLNQIKSIALLGLFSTTLMVGCSTTKETTTTTQADPSRAPMDDTRVVSSSSTTSVEQVVSSSPVADPDGEDVYVKMTDEQRAEYFLYNEDLEGGVEVDVTVSRPVAAIYFDFDVVKLDRANMIGVERAYTWLEMHPDKGLAIIGHADKEGSHPYNQQLALNRAQAAGNALMQKGISSKRLIIISHGEDHSQYEDPKYNRRVIFKTDPTNAYGVNKPEEDDDGVIRVVTAAK